MSQLYELSNRLDEDVECMEIEGSVTIKCGNKSDKLSFKSTYENGFLGTSKKDFFWKNGKRPENFEMVFVEFGDALLKMQGDYMVNYDIRPENLKTKDE